MKKLILVALACCALVYAADETPVQKIVPVRNGDVAQVFVTVRDLMAGMPVAIRMYQNTVVLNGKPEAVTAAEQLIKNLESSTPREHDIEVTGYIILASVQAGDGGSMPAELDPVLKQFRSLLSYKAFRVLDTIIMRAKEGSQANSSGLLALPNAIPGTTVQFHLDRATVSDDVVHIKSLTLSAIVGIPTNQSGGYKNTEIRIGTDVDIKAGQKVAIGKASVNTNGDALILVVSAKVVD